MHMVGKGVPVRGEKRSVKPSDGEAYLDAVEAMFASSSHWLVSRDEV